MRYCMIGKSKCVPCFFSKPKPMRNLEFLHNFGVRRSPLSKQCFRVELSPKTLRREPSKSRPLQTIGFIVGVPERYSIGSVPPARSCPEIGGQKGQANEAWVGRWREDSRPGIRGVPPQSLPPATRRVPTASTRALAALGSLPEARWSDARSRGRSSAQSHGD